MISLPVLTHHCLLSAVAGALSFAVSAGILLWRSRARKLSQESNVENPLMLPLLEDIPHFVYIVDPADFSMLYANRVARENIGEIEGKKCFTLIHGRTTPCEPCHSFLLFKENMAGHEATSEAYNEITHRTYSITSRLIDWRDGRKALYQIATDISVLKHTQEDLGQRLKFEELVSAISSQFARTMQPAEVFADVLGLLGNHLNVNRVSFFAIDPGLKECSIVYQWKRGVEDQLSKGRKFLWRETPWLINEINAGHTVVSEDLSELPQPDKDALAIRGVKSFLAFPLRFEKRSMGFLKFDDCFKKRPWSPLELRLLKAVADMISQAAKRQEDIEARDTALGQLINAERLSSLGTLVAGVAHEINNPNNFIMFNVSLLIDRYWKEVKPALKEYSDRHPVWKIGDLTFSELCNDMEEIFHDIRTGSSRIKGIVENLKDFARIDNGGAGEAFDISECVDRAVKIGGVSIRNKIQDFTCTVDPNMPAIVGHRQRIEQVIINIMLNAISALDGRKESIVRLHAFLASQTTIRIDVEDNGVGMCSEVASRIFDPFFTTRKESGGTGLGLSVSYGIVRDHGGKILVESNQGKGTRFSVLLPVLPGNALTAPVPGLLVVDDDEEFVKWLVDQVNGIGRNVVGISDPRNAPDVVSGDPDIMFVLLDQHMPHITGIDLIGMLRSIRPFLSIYIMSGRFSAEFANQAVQAGASGFLQKPIQDVNDLLRIIGMNKHENTDS
ncbi:MAG: ATP-binding protein [Pseudomonadota bacterium]